MAALLGGLLFTFTSRAQAGERITIAGIAKKAVKGDGQFANEYMCAIALKKDEMYWIVVADEKNRPYFQFQGVRDGKAGIYLLTASGNMSFYPIDVTKLKPMDVFAASNKHYKVQIKTPDGVDEPANLLEPQMNSEEKPPYINVIISRDAKQDRKYSSQRPIPDDYVPLPGYKVEDQASVDLLASRLGEIIQKLDGLNKPGSRQTKEELLKKINKTCCQIPGLDPILNQHFRQMGLEREC